MNWHRRMHPVAIEEVMTSSDAQKREALLRREANHLVAGNAR
jgi:hypothetical protein